MNEKKSHISSRITVPKPQITYILEFQNRKTDVYVNLHLQIRHLTTFYELIQHQPSVISGEGIISTSTNFI